MRDSRASGHEVSPAELASILHVEQHDTEAGPVYLRDAWYPPDHEHGALPLSALFHAPAEAFAHVLSLPGAPHPSRLAYFDIETTGLAGGAGTYIVLAGLGSFEADGFRVRQYFLADIAHERAMLSQMASDIGRFEGIVTYNGRAFDVPCVEARLTLARLRSPCAGLAHFDLLHAVRRLYKHRMPGCRLAEAERKLLKIERIDDISGALIPPLYFEYARTGRMAPLRGVFRHNLDDVLSLVGVLTNVASLLSGRELDPEDAVAVARWWERAGQPVRALPLYRDALPWLHRGDDWAWAAGRYAMLLKRAGQRGEAVSVWSELSKAGDRASLLELAKHYEHHERDFGAAERMAEALLGDRGSDDRQALEARLARIRRKAAVR